MAYEHQNYVQHQLTLEGRERLTVSGVEDVERFDESSIVMSTAAGTLVVSGENLHIGKLSSTWTARSTPSAMRRAAEAAAGF